MQTLTATSSYSYGSIAIRPTNSDSSIHGTPQHSNLSSRSLKSDNPLVGIINESSYIPLKNSYPKNETVLTTSYVKRAIRKSSDTVLKSLGFYKNVIIAPSTENLYQTAVIGRTEIAHDKTTDTREKRNSSYADMRLSMISNFSASYNTVNISLGLALMNAMHPPKHPSDVSLCSSALIAGMIIGQLAGGMLGDWLGRHLAMSIVMSLQVASAFWSAWVGLLFGETLGIYHTLSVCRFLLGVGCGGVYPLAATLTAESSTQRENREKLVALTFSMQGVAYLTVSLTSYVLVRILGDDSDLAWRLLLGFGSLPGLCLIIIRTCQHNSETPEIDEKQTSSVRLEPTHLLQQIHSEPFIVTNILGTAGCWFLFDILFYGNILFQPVVFTAAFGQSETVLAVVRDSIVVALIALPGYFVSVYMVGKQTPKQMQLQGFLIMGLLYAIIGVKFSWLSSNRLALVLMYGLTFFFSNYGPNTTTFMMPSITFSRSCRSTLNGVCAASGKAGALLGSIIFLPVATRLGDDKVMIACSMISIIAAFMTLYLKDSVEMPTKRVSSEVHLLSVGSTDSEAPKLVKLKSMASIFDHI